ncbi:MAG: hypothetical protein IPK00_16050 [Deltaproteobacteria bacterium]|nr:hypothetical protein [Deltaproteobacteria bacterium]
MGDFTCTCNVGFTGDGLTCSPVGPPTWVRLRIGRWRWRENILLNAPFFGPRCRLDVQLTASALRIALCALAQSASSSAVAASAAARSTRSRASVRSANQ